MTGYDGLVEPDDSANASAEQTLAENLHLICPNCNARMLDRGCKLICQRCGYFMGCSDYV
jgi:hypothetical protein